MFPIVTTAEWSSQISPKEAPADSARRWPVSALSRRSLTIGLTAVCVLIALLPGASEGLQFDRPALVAGEYWRLITGHFTHWSNEHLAWDLLVFVVLGSICEAVDRRRFAGVLAAAAIIIAAGVWIALPGVPTYRGLSGLDTALFTALAMGKLRSATRDLGRGWSLAIAALLALLVAKMIFEMLTDRTVFVDAPAAGFRPVPLAHVLGAAVGALGALLPATSVRAVHCVARKDCAA